jgi:hypothetical protein
MTKTDDLLMIIHSNLRNSLMILTPCDFLDIAYSFINGSNVSGPTIKSMALTATPRTVFFTIKQPLI